MDIGCDEGCDVLSIDCVVVCDVIDVEDARLGVVDTREVRVDANITVVLVVVVVVVCFVVVCFVVVEGEVGFAKSVGFVSSIVKSGFCVVDGLVKKRS